MGEFVWYWYCFITSIVEKIYWTKRVCGIICSLFWHQNLNIPTSSSILQEKDGVVTWICWSCLLGYIPSVIQKTNKEKSSMDQQVFSMEYSNRKTNAQIKQIWSCIILLLRCQYWTWWPLIPMQRDIHLFKTYKTRTKKVQKQLEPNFISPIVIWHRHLCKGGNPTIHTHMSSYRSKGSKNREVWYC